MTEDRVPAGDPAPTGQTEGADDPTHETPRGFADRGTSEPGISDPIASGAGPSAAFAGGHTGHSMPEDGTPALAAFAYRHGLVRPVNGRLFAGVCAAFGRATNTDPVLWRVVVAVLTIFGGAGLLLYLLAWLLLPAEGDSGAPVEAVLGRGRSATNTVITVIVAVIVVITAIALIGGDANPGLLGVILLGGAVLLLLRDQRGRRTPAPATAPMWSTPPPPVATAGAAGPGSGSTWPAPPGPVTPPPPGGYSQPPFAPRGPYPAPGTPPPFGPPPFGPATPTPPPAPRPPVERSPLGLLTFSMVLIVLGGLALADTAGLDIPAAGYVAASLAIVGLGLLIGAWVGRGRSMIAVGILLSLALAVVGTVDRIGPDWQGGGSVTWVPDTVGEIQSRYSHDFGDATLDLSNVDFSGQTVTVAVDVSFGSFEIIVPEDVDVETTADVSLGGAQIFGDDWAGLDPGTRTVINNGDDGPGGGKLILDASADFGNVEVRR